MTSAAAKKAWESRRRGGLTKKEEKWATTPARSHKRGRKAKKGKGKKGKGMPENVKNYFKWINAGKSKAEAKRLSGMGKAPEAKEGGPEKKVSKSWGPGHPLYDWKQKHK
jgi:hypothetical protein